MGPSHPVAEAPRQPGAPERIPIVFGFVFFSEAEELLIFAEHFLPSASLGLVLVEAREFYSNLDISRSLIYFAVAGCL